MYGISADDPLISLWVKKSHGGEAKWLPLYISPIPPGAGRGKSYARRKVPYR
jgi:hypothetical protein